MLSNHTILSFIIIAVLSVILIVIALINRQTTTKPNQPARSKYIKCSTPESVELSNSSELRLIDNCPKTTRIIVNEPIGEKPCHNCYFAVKLEHGGDGVVDRFVGCRYSQYHHLETPIMTEGFIDSNGIEIVDMDIFSGENICAAQRQIYYNNR